MACGKTKTVAGNLEKEPLFDINIELANNIKLAFAGATAQWKNMIANPSIPIKKSVQDPQPVQDNTIDIETNKQATALKNSISDLERQAASMAAELDKQKEVAKKLKKDYLLSEIRNELLVYLTMEQTLQYEKFCQEIDIKQ